MSVITSTSTATTTTTTKTTDTKITRETSIRTTKSILNIITTSPSSPIETLNEKLTEQISQMQVLIKQMDDNRLAMKRLIDMMAHFFDKQNHIYENRTTNTGSARQWFKSNKSIDTDDQSKKTIGRFHQSSVDNHTLHVSFGTDADPDRYPWAVAIRGNDRDRCGGTLIDDQHILTAAHCIGTRSTEIYIGSHRYDDGEEVKPSFYCVHFGYSSSTYYRNDLAVIRLAKPVSVLPPKRVSTIEICNRSQTVNLAVAQNQVNLWMIGWGLKSDEVEPDELQEAQVALTDRSMCQGSNRYTDLCVQSRSSRSPMGACTGDSGSGLFHQTIGTNKWCLLGVTSSSNTHICEQTQFTTYVHAASHDYELWFRDVLDQKKSFDDLQRMERCKSRTWGQEFCRWYAC